MRIKKKYVLLPLVVVLIFAVVGYGTLRLMDIRSFQFFGGLVDHIETDQKVIALTFDDAPTLQVTSVLQTLGQKNVRATFFEIGSAIEKYPQLARAITLAGMQVGNHSYSHQRMVFKPFSFYQHEVDKTNQLIRATGYSGEIMFRPPNGKKLVGLPWFSTSSIFVQSCGMSNPIHLRIQVQAMGTRISW
jgi:peptidoglycan/xylan/chitin deacetylase (PgdA/CDA1 family)